MHSVHQSAKMAQGLAAKELNYVGVRKYYFGVHLAYELHGMHPGTGLGLLYVAGLGFFVGLGLILSRKT